jgi:hypothetical protein
MARAHRSFAYQEPRRLSGHSRTLARVIHDATFARSVLECAKPSGTFGPGESSLYKDWDPPDQPKMQLLTLPRRL